MQSPSLCELNNLVKCFKKTPRLLSKPVPARAEEMNRPQTVWMVFGREMLQDRTFSTDNPAQQATKFSRLIVDLFFCKSETYRVLADKWRKEKKKLKCFLGLVNIYFPLLWKCTVYPILWDQPRTLPVISLGTSMSDPSLTICWTACSLNTTRAQIYKIEYGSFWPTTNEYKTFHMWKNWMCFMPRPVSVFWYEATWSRPH